MDVHVPLSLLITLLTLTSLLAGCAFGAWHMASRSTRTTKRQPSPPATLPSELQSQIASLQADQAASYSTLEKLTTTVKRLSSRQGMRDRRDRDQAEFDDPPKGTSKADLLRHYGMSGKVGPAFAQAQLELEAKLRDGDRTQ